MDGNQFDRLTRVMALQKLNRRRAVQGVAAGVAGAAFGKRMAAAQDATPETETGERRMTLFVQTANAGTFEPNDAAQEGSGTHLLTLSGHPGQTISFADRPARDFGQVGTTTFLDTLGFSGDNPPNAALVTHNSVDDQDVVILELLNPSYDEAANVLVYEANILGTYAGEGLAPVASAAEDAQISPAFETPSLFIDDCPDADPLNCYDEFTDYKVGDLGNQGMCWSWAPIGCHPCIGIDNANQQCSQFSCGDACVAGY